MDYKIRYINGKNKIILLTFFPYGDDITRWGKRKCYRARDVVLSFCDQFGEQAQIDNSHCLFNRIEIEENSIIDLSNWKVLLLCSKPQRQFELQDFFNYEKIGEFWKKKYSIEDLFKELFNRDKGHYAELFNSLPTNNHFYPFSENYSDNSPIIISLKAFLQRFGNFYSVKDSKISIEFFETLHNKEDSILIFIENEKSIEWYNENRHLFYSNKIPTQLIKRETFLEKSKFPGVRANLLLELLTKMNKQPLVLKIPEDINTADGFLCLTDLEGAKEKLFGALVTYLRGIERNGKIQIYRDIDYNVNQRRDRINFPGKEKIDLLAEKISILAEADLSLDILITKEWKNEDLKRLISKLKNNNITIKKVYYISTKRSRFVDNSIGIISRTTNPYIIVNEKIAFLRSTTEIRIYANIPQVYIELKWPLKEAIQENDLKKILWLIKKRLYRIQEFGVLNTPEPLFIFKTFGKYLSRIKEGTTIPLNIVL
ncbi:MAG: hypothetical protein K9W42_06525 [Candidatus Heimdallarchaeota archaeon]|nr:hypothetical protein [Candidatus Heimdallarchaeota archaeon]